MKAQFTITHIPLQLANQDGEKSAYEVFKDIFNKYFKSYNIQPRSALGIYEIEIFQTTGKALAGFEEEAAANGITIKQD